MIQELEKVIMSIELDIMEQTGGVEYFNMVVKSNGFCQKVSFIGIELWNSEDDMRNYIDENEEIHEPIENFLRREINNEINKLKVINV